MEHLDPKEMTDDQIAEKIDFISRLDGRERKENLPYGRKLIKEYCLVRLPKIVDDVLKKDPSKAYEIKKYFDELLNK
jgi:TorA maturation chaperone TorD